MLQLFNIDVIQSDKGQTAAAQRNPNFEELIGALVPAISQTISAKAYQPVPHITQEATQQPVKQAAPAVGLQEQRKRRPRAWESTHKVLDCDSGTNKP
ncbi:uncharacterized protein A1O5_10010 [Cladophialophora psammophila CBS 110553]|uniref:Uncharacterized protein n=1 Tax=Cladophialophora psammophila CBS 110553 TaxID=1182543 RepID=W9WP96_9EURO|nr:uncharacterized protein A1O5_10010 [Cladophialophora psammophila CBS 110553]EXJ66815.1 hypothetical protein A1O5_10010 [Cladophialophora psammophila CBS 110553]